MKGRNILRSSYVVCNHVYAKRKIGMTSEDVSDSLKKVLGGTAVSLSSPRLVIPAFVYGLWAFSQHFHNDILNFEVQLLCTSPLSFWIFCHLNVNL
jgi:hypothetical protein